jgi:hypothetical protein
MTKMGTDWPVNATLRARSENGVVRGSVSERRDPRAIQTERKYDMSTTRQHGFVSAAGLLVNPRILGSCTMPYREARTAA